ncbi:glycosyltransferase family 39 protein [Nodosilinea sp. LEGE 06152]|uniref:glycosyltransferase family 39 protein n=1 Tax=Nodosilinea sp. LEGE 06152 TaxID=2777966 RepID=UPI001880E0A0|nr:glycosyltransferase family 39 protein [Nodosilinea sp. LEGE 06152]MBE9158879.1 glycosyltransferase family 39 protein [Nodosilinea sp. LEGE 06152]
MIAQRSQAPAAFPKASGLTLLLAALIALGIVFRFAHLDRQVYWHDEAYTSLHLSGYAVPDLEQALFTGQPVTVADLQRFQRLSPGRNVTDTVAALATYDAQHPPLYYVLARLWAGLVGDSVTAIRAVSALLALLALPFAHWLGWELFRSPPHAALLTGLVAISPFHSLYAQEAREYGLWTAMVLFSSAALLRALRHPSPRWWAIYALSLTLGLYTFLLTVLVMLAHGLYVLAMQGLRLTRPLGQYLLATAASGVLIVPWLVQVASQSARIVASTAWLGQPRSLPELTRSWLADVGRVFVDFNLGSDDPLLLSLPIVLVLAGLVGYALVVLVRRAPVAVWAFVLLLGGVTALGMMLPDVLWGGHRSSISRYLIPTWLSLQLAVAHWMGLVLTTADRVGKRWQRGAIALLLTAAVLSNGVILQADTWWTKYSSQAQPAIAEQINRSPRPLLVSSNHGTNTGELLSLSHALANTVTLVLVCEPQAVPPLPTGYSDLFLFNPSPHLQATLWARGYVLDVIYEPGLLWRAT